MTCKKFCDPIYPYRSELVVRTVGSKISPILPARPSGPQYHQHVHLHLVIAAASNPLDSQNGSLTRTSLPVPSAALNSASGIANITVENAARSSAVTAPHIASPFPDNSSSSRQRQLRAPTYQLRLMPYLCQWGMRLCACVIRAFRIQTVLHHRSSSTMSGLSGKALTDQLTWPRPERRARPQPIFRAV